MNNLRFIYLTKIKDQDDIENYKKAFYYLNKVSCVQFSYIQNNYGLFYQFYDNNDDHAKEYYENASKMKFALAKYNLGYLKEKGKDMINAINLYIEASSFENEPIYYQNKKYDDLRLEISKIFVICLTNLILSVHFFNNLTFDSSKKYFIRIFSKLQINNDDNIYKFHFHMQKGTEKKVFLYIKKFILEFPLFNLRKNNFDIDSYFKNQNENETNEVKTNEESIQTCFKKNNGDNFNDINDIIFEDPGKLFDYIKNNGILKSIFCREINDLINEMKSILYQKPYAILFGRISIEKNRKNNQKNINESFYEGFSISLI